MERSESLDVLSIIIQGQLNTGLVYEFQQCLDKDKNITLYEFYEKWIEKQPMNNGQPLNYRPFNPVLLISSAYIYFVYPKDRTNDNIFNNLQEHEKSFTILLDEQHKCERDGIKEICRRVRNSLAHGNFSIQEDNKIVFEDGNPPPKSEKFKKDFEASIEMVDFGKFISGFGKEVKKFFLGEK